MRYKITSEIERDGPTYYIIDTVTDAKVGMFPTQKWAESIAQLMEAQHIDKSDSKGRRGKGSADASTARDYLGHSADPDVR